MVLYFECLSKDLDPTVSKVLSVLVLVAILSLPFLLSMCPGKDSSKDGHIYTMLMVFVIFLAVLQVLALFCKKYKNI